MIHSVHLSGINRRFIENKFNLSKIAYIMI